MPRKPRIVKTGLPHHIIQRGVRRMNVFHKPNDYAFYLDLLKEWSAQAQLDIWAYCLMSNHIHLVAVPHTPDSLRLALSQTNRRYASMVNKREGATGHLWEGRFKSYPIEDDPYLLSVVRYVERNPVDARIVSAPAQYRWSSAPAHVTGGNREENLLNDEPLRQLIPDWTYYLNEIEHPEILNKIKKSSE